MKKLNVKKLGELALNKTGKVGTFVKKHNAEIFLGVGIVAGAVAVVEAAKAGSKTKAVIDDHKDIIDMIHEEAEDGQITIYCDNEETQVVEYTEKDVRRDITHTYLHTAGELGKLYLPAATALAASTASILYSYKIIKGRNVALTAAYTALESGFKRYRNNVIERYGEEVDMDMKLGRKTVPVTIEEIDENGKKTKTKQTATVFKDPSEYSDFSRFFDSANPNWKPNAHYNMQFLKQQQEYATLLLKSRGHIFMNEVYDMLGFERTPEGAVTGWVKGCGDDFVDFGIYEAGCEANRRFVNGYEDVILLDFNHDGIIFDKI